MAAESIAAVIEPVCKNQIWHCGPLDIPAAHFFVCNVPTESHKPPDSPAVAKGGPSVLWKI